MQSSLIWLFTFSVDYITVIVASYKNDMASKLHITLLGSWPTIYPCLYKMTDLLLFSCC